MSASIFPLQEMMLICNGCGGERQIPREELDQILTVQDFDRFAKGRIAAYSCRCGARTCDIRMLPAERREQDQGGGEHGNA